MPALQGPGEEGGSPWRWHGANLVREARSPCSQADAIPLSPAYPLSADALRTQCEFLEKSRLKLLKTQDGKKIQTMESLISIVPSQISVSAMPPASSALLAVHALVPAEGTRPSLLLSLGKCKEGAGVRWLRELQKGGSVQKLRDSQSQGGE